MVKVVPISSSRELKKFTRFKNLLYKGHKYAIPTLESDELATLNEKKNPAMEFCQRQCFLAYDEKGKIVGRICAIINTKANKTWNNTNGRFGFFDFIEDIEVAKALLEAAEAWVKERGMTGLVGPLGFTDMDEEGMLTEGYEELGTMATLYNYPYYPKFMQELGYRKDAGWVEMLLTIPRDTPPARIARFSNIVKEKNNLKVIKLKNTKEMIKQGWAHKIFKLINQEYAKLYGYTEMNDRQIEHYVKMYMPIARLELICMIADQEDNLVGFGISLPSLSHALQKSRGRLFPFGWYYMLRALKSKKAEYVDLMLIAVDKKYQNKGLTAIIINDITEGIISLGCEKAETNPELEVNETMQNQWGVFTNRVHKRRCTFIKENI